MDYGLPKTVDICAEEIPVRYDYRVILDIFDIYDMDELSGSEKICAALYIFYPGFPDLPDAPDYGESIAAMQKFINGGKAEKQQKQAAKLVSWADDFHYICSAVNRVLGYEVRAVEYDIDANTGGVHWYTFLSAYMEIGDCFFAQVVGIRSKRHNGMKRDKSDQEFYKANRELIECVDRKPEADKEWLSEIL